MSTYTTFKPATVAAIPLQDAMTRYLRGDRMSDMCADYNTSMTTLCRYLSQNGAPARERARRTGNRPKPRPTAHNLQPSRLCGDCRHWKPDVPISDWDKMPRIDDGVTLPIRDGRCGLDGSRKERCEGCTP